MYTISYWKSVFFALMALQQKKTIALLNAKPSMFVFVE